jgi:hypothetical protein
MRHIHCPQSKKSRNLIMGHIYIPVATIRTFIANRWGVKRSAHSGANIVSLSEEAERISRFSTS